MPVGADAFTAPRRPADPVARRAQLQHQRGLFIFRNCPEYLPNEHPARVRGVRAKIHHSLLHRVELNPPRPQLADQQLTHHQVAREPVHALNYQHAHPKLLHEGEHLHQRWPVQPLDGPAYSQVAKTLEQPEPTATRKFLDAGPLPNGAVPLALRLPANADVADRTRKGLFASYDFIDRFVHSIQIAYT